MSLAETYNYYNDEIADPRLKDWFLINSTFQVVLVLFAYAYFVVKCGPQYMEKKKPYSLKTFIFYYNIFQIVANASIVYGYYVSGSPIGEWSWKCVPLRQNETTPDDLLFVKFCYATFMLKVIDLIETFVYVLRKKNNQVSFLHLYHHISTVLVTYICVKYFSGAMTSTQMVVNGSVHVIMYTYYLLASLGPNVQKIINPFKPYITRIQIVQFFVLIAHQSQGFLPSCPLPKKLPILTIGNVLLNLVLFLNFYKKNYSKKRDKRS